MAACLRLSTVVHLHLSTAAYPHRNMEECLLLSMGDCLPLNTVASRLRSMADYRPHNMGGYRHLSMVACRLPRVGVCPRPPSTSIEAIFHRGPISLENWKREAMTGHPN